MNTEKKQTQYLYENAEKEHSSGNINIMSGGDQVPWFTKCLSLYCLLFQHNLKRYVFWNNIFRLRHIKVKNPTNEVANKRKLCRLNYTEAVILRMILTVTQQSFQYVPMLVSSMLWNWHKMSVKRWNSNDKMVSTSCFIVLLLQHN